MVDFFAKPAKIVKKPTKAKKEKQTFSLGKDFDKLAAIRWIQKSFEVLAEELEENIRTKIFNIFVSENPGNFKGIGEDGMNSASCQLRKKTSRSVLKPDEVEILNQHNVSYDTVIQQEAIPEHFRFNPEYMSDHTILKILNEALKVIPGLPQDIIQYVPEQEEIKIDIVNDDTLKDAFAIVNPAEKAKVVAICSTLVLKIDSDIENLSEAMEYMV